MLFVSLPTLFLSLFLFVLFRLSGFLELGDKWLKGLHFCVPVTLEEEKIVKGKQKKKKKNSTESKAGLAVAMSQIELGTLTRHSSYGNYLMMVYGLVAVLAGYFFEQCWYLFQVLKHPENKIDENSTKSAFLFLLMAFYIGYCLKTMMGLLRILGGKSSEYKVSIVCGFVGFIFNLLVVEFPPLTDSLDFDLPKGYDLLQTNINAFVKYFVSNTTLAELVDPEDLTIAIPRAAMNIGLSLIGAYIAGVVFLSGFRLARCHNYLQTHERRLWSQASSGMANIVAGVALLMWVKPFKDLIVNARIPSGLETDAYDLIITEETWESTRFSALVIVSVVRLALFRNYIQTFLESALTYGMFYLSMFKKESDAKINYNTKAVAIYSLTCVVASELLGATLLLVFLLLLIFDYGGVDFGVVNGILWLLGRTPGTVVLRATTASGSGTLIESVARFYAAAPVILTKEVVYPLFSFFCWWYTLCLSAHLLIGYIYVNLWQMTQEDLQEAKQRKRAKNK